MKLNISSDFIDSGNLQQTGEFTIRSSPLAFQILSSSLYSDKISAVIRELSCNAADAHIAVGLPDQPFVVKLPNQLDREFYILDNGPGLTHKEVCDPEEGLYTTYFASSKHLSNDVTGAFGLGSKSPFAYTDQFTIETARDGEHRTYLAYKGAMGVLRCDLVNTRPATDNWPHGLKVSMPVAPKDFNEFRNKARNILGWFNPLPKLIGDTDLTPNGSETNLGTIKIECSGLGQPYILMGNVAYRIDRDMLQSHRLMSDPNDKQLATVAWYDDWLLRAPIGAVDITPSRETLEYTDKTVLYLRSAFIDIADRASQALVDLLATTDQTFPSVNALLRSPEGIKMRIPERTKELLLSYRKNGLDDQKIEWLFNDAIKFEDLFDEFTGRDELDRLMQETRVIISTHNLTLFNRRYWWSKTGSHRGEQFRSSKINPITDLVTYNSKFFLNDKDSRAIPSKLLKHHFSSFSGYLYVLNADAAQALIDQKALLPSQIVNLSTLAPVPKAPRAVAVRTPGAQPVRRTSKRFPFFDFTDGGTSEVALKDIPETARFFATRRRQHGSDYVLSSNHDGSVGLNVKPLNLWQAIRNIQDAFPSFTGLPTGIVYCTPSQEARLLKNGFAPAHSFIEPIVHAILTEYNALSHDLKISSCNTDKWWPLFAKDHRPCKTHQGDKCLHFLMNVVSSPELTEFMLENSPNSPQRQLLEQFKTRYAIYLSDCKNQFLRLETLHGLCRDLRATHPNLTLLQKDFSNIYIDITHVHQNLVVIHELDALALVHPLEWPISADKVIEKAGWEAASKYLLALFTSTEQEISP